MRNVRINPKTNKNIYRSSYSTESHYRSNNTLRFTGIRIRILKGDSNFSYLKNYHHNFTSRYLSDLVYDKNKTPWEFDFENKEFILINHDDLINHILNPLPIENLSGAWKVKFKFSLETETVKNGFDFNKMLLNTGHPKPLVESSPKFKSFYIYNYNEEKGYRSSGGGGSERSVYFQLPEREIYGLIYNFLQDIQKKIPNLKTTDVIRDFEDIDEIAEKYPQVILLLDIVFAKLGLDLDKYLSLFRDFVNNENNENYIQKNRSGLEAISLAYFGSVHWQYPAFRQEDFNVLLAAEEDFLTKDLIQILIDEMNVPTLNKNLFKACLPLDILEEYMAEKLNNVDCFKEEGDVSVFTIDCGEIEFKDINELLDPDRLLNFEENIRKRKFVDPSLRHILDRNVNFENLVDFLKENEIVPFVFPNADEAKYFRHFALIDAIIKVKGVIESLPEGADFELKFDYNNQEMIFDIGLKSNYLPLIDFLFSSFMNPRWNIENRAKIPANFHYLLAGVSGLTDDCAPAREFIVELMDRYTERCESMLKMKLDAFQEKLFKENQSEIESVIESLAISAVDDN